MPSHRASNPEADSARPKVDSQTLSTSTIKLAVEVDGAATILAHCFKEILNHEMTSASITLGLVVP